MSYRIRFTLPDGRTGLSAHEYHTSEEAKRAIDDRLVHAGFDYAVEEVPEPGSTAEHHVKILRARVKELEALVEERGKAVTDAHVANHAMHQDLTFALQIGDAMREAMRHGAWGHDGEGHLASVSAGSWDHFKASLAKAPSVPVGASEASGEGGDSDRRRLEALERFLGGKQSASVAWWQGEFSAVHVSDGVEITAPTLAALADKLAEKEAKP